MPTRRALLAALIPGVVVLIVFWFWLKMSVTASVAAGIAWAIGSYLVTRYLYDDADAEMAAWREEAPDLAGPVNPPSPVDQGRRASAASPVGHPEPVAHATPAAEQHP